MSSGQWCAGDTDCFQHLSRVFGQRIDTTPYHLVEAQAFPIFCTEGDMAYQLRDIERMALRFCRDRGGIHLEGDFFLIDT